MVAHRLMAPGSPPRPSTKASSPRRRGRRGRLRPTPVYLASPLEAPVESLGEAGSGSPSGSGTASARSDPAGASGPPLVARRGIDHRALPELTGGRCRAARRHRARTARSSPGATAGRCRSPCCNGGSAQEADGKGARRGAGRLHGYDVLEIAGRDARELPLAERRQSLERLLDRGRPFLLVSPSVEAATWEELARAREEARERNVEGFDVKRLSSPYAPAASGGLVEVEDRALHRRRRAGLRPCRAWPAGEPAHRLHLRRLVRG